MDNLSSVRSFANRIINEYLKKPKEVRFSKLYLEEGTLAKAKEGRKVVYVDEFLAKFVDRIDRHDWNSYFKGVIVHEVFHLISPLASEQAAVNFSLEEIGWSEERFARYSGAMEMMAILYYQEGYKLEKLVRAEDIIREKVTIEI